MSRGLDSDNLFAFVTYITFAAGNNNGWYSGRRGVLGTRTNPFLESSPLPQKLRTCNPENAHSVQPPHRSVDKAPRVIVRISAFAGAAIVPQTTRSAVH